MDLKKEHHACKEIFDKLFDTPDGESVACDIWRSMVGEGENFDNCIGENFNQLLRTIGRDWFGSSGIGDTTIEFYCTTYILWLYLVVSRTYEILDSLNPKKSNDFIEKKRVSLQAFNEINLWAKFIKHPKEFIFCHWPEHTCEGHLFNKQGERTIISSSYLKDHYASEAAKRPTILKNNINVVGLHMLRF